MSETETEAETEEETPETGNTHECQRCGRKEGLVSRYNIYLCRQCFREVARDMGAKKYN
ncbi:MAG: 30S ribosomal protein S14 [Halobacteria archaeon]|nr:30S ribosomal protein S14 [Halobacteria archaeon]